MGTKKPLYKLIATTLNARDNSLAAKNMDWVDRHEGRLSLYEKLLPSGSGFDSGTTIDMDESVPNSVVLRSAYHTMQEGFYGPWIYLTITITPDLAFDFELNIEIEGKEETIEALEESNDDLDHHLDYFYEEFDIALRQMYDPEKIIS